MKQRFKGVVQASHETAEEFGKRLEVIVEELLLDNSVSDEMGVIPMMTASSDGRMTAMLCYHQSHCKREQNDKNDLEKDMTDHYVELFNYQDVNMDLGTFLKQNNLYIDKRK